MSTVTFTKKHLEKLPEIAERLRQRDENEPATAASNCLACDGAGTVCCGCRRPESHCECAGGCIASDACEDCKGEGTKPAPKEEYGSPVAGEADLRDDEPMPDAAKDELKSEVTALIGEHELLAEIREAEALVSTAEQRWQDAAEHAKDLKKIYETRVSDLRAAIRGAGPLFCQPVKGTPAESDPEGLKNGATNRWRKTCIDDLQAYRLSPSIVAKLRDKSLETLGDLADFQEKHGEFWPKEIKGLGPSKAAQVTDAQAAYWQSHPEYCGAAT